jgi:glycosyltransferase involved in cell wall biosynthesis
MSAPLVSVVMATYNGARFLPLQLDSILGQTYPNLEIIVVDDASQDATRDILADYQRRDSRIRVLHALENRGVVATFEEALGHAAGEFVAFSDQDDIFHPEKIARQVEHLQANSAADLCLSDLSVIDDEGHFVAESMRRYQHLAVRPGKPFNELLYLNFATGCAMMVRRRLVSLALPFPPDCMVHDWWLSVLSASSRGGGIVLMPEALTYYRQHTSNVIGAREGGLSGAIKRAPTLAYRCDWYQRNVRRLRGYLARDIWDEADRKAIREVMGLLTLMAADDRNGFFRRLASLGARMRYTLPFGRVYSLGILAFALFPRIVDILRPK